jgi:hypothetical protein
MSSIVLSCVLHSKIIYNDVEFKGVVCMFPQSRCVWTWIMALRCEYLLQEDALFFVTHTHLLYLDIKVAIICDACEIIL